MTTDRLGFTFASLMGLGPRLAVETAERAEQLGYRSFWTAETTGPEAFSLLAAAGAAAPSLDLGTGVLALQLRTPMVVAMGAATLQALQPERDVLIGVGISSPVVTERWHGTPYGDRPLARVREYVTLVKECLSGEKVDFEGDFYTVKGFRLGVRLGERKPKVVIGALNPAMLRIGRRGRRRRPPQLPAGLARAVVGRADPQGRRRRRSTPTSTPACAEREDGIELARRDLFSYAVVDAYARNFERAGFADEVVEVRERHAAGDRAGAVAAVSDRMVDAIDVMGDADHVLDTVQAYAAAGVDVPVLMPLPWGPDRRQVIEDTMVAAAG